MSNTTQPVSTIEYIKRNGGRLAQKRGTNLHTQNWHTLVVPVYWYHSVLPVGTDCKVFQSTNFGWMVLRTPVDGRRLFRY